MKNLMKKLGVAAVALAMSVSFANADVKIGIATEAYPPFVEKSADGDWIGWELEIIDAVCAAMKEKCEIVPVAWDDIIPALLAKKFDAIMASMSITEKRKKTIAFSNKYYNTPAAIVAPKNSGIDGTPESVKGKIIGVQVSTKHANYAEKYFASGAEVKIYNVFGKHTQDLVAGRIDAVVDDSIALQPFLTSSEGACCEIKAVLSDDTVLGPGVGAGMRKGEDELAAKINAAIEKIRSDGTYEKISKKYFDFDIFGG